MPLIRKTLVYLITLEAQLILGKFKPHIIAVTGSVGKTTTKDAIYATIAGAVHVRKSSKSFNSDIGVPLTILGVDNPWSDPLAWLAVLWKGLRVYFFETSYPLWLILEVGADRPGDIRKAAVWLLPDIVVFTGVSEIPAHVEYFASPEAVFEEKKTLVEYLRPSGTLIVNGDDVRAKVLIDSFKGISYTYGFAPSSEYRAEPPRIAYEQDRPVGIHFYADTPSSSGEVSIKGSLGRPRVYAALAAIAVADVLEVDQSTARAAISAWEPPPGRMRLLRGINNSTIIDDTYNSSPVAAFSALDSLKEIEFSKRKIAVLGDMLELGKFSAESHARVGERAAACVDTLLTVGFRSRAMGEAALSHGMRDAQVREYEQNEAVRAGHELETELREGDVVLIKGSQGMRLERAVALLMEDKAHARDLLVRQDDEWIAKE